MVNNNIYHYLINNIYFNKLKAAIKNTSLKKKVLKGIDAISGNRVPISYYTANSNTKQYIYEILEEDMLKMKEKYGVDVKKLEI